MSPEELTSRNLKNKRLSILLRFPPQAAPLLPWQPGQGLAAPQKAQQTENEASERHRGGPEADSRNWKSVVNSQYARVLKNPKVQGKHRNFRHEKGSPQLEPKTTSH